LAPDIVSSNTVAAPSARQLMELRPMRSAIDDLAIFGGQPAFDRILHVGRPNLGPREHLLRRMGEVFDSGWLTNDGPLVKEFEAAIAAMTGARECVATCNATVALQVLARAAGLTGEVIVPAFTSPATPHALEWIGLTPVFADIEPVRHTIDPAVIEALLTPRTSAILAVHTWGRPCAIKDLEAIARRHSLHLLFDAAHALGSSYHGRMLGTFGEAEVLSFHGTKFLNTAEGGAVVTNDVELAKRVRTMRTFGYARFDQVDSLGTNAKMPETSAALGLVNLESIEHFVDANRANYNAYRDGLADVNGITVLEFDEGEKNNYQYVVIEVDAPVAGFHRDDLLDILWAENVHARRHFFPGCHRMEPYRSRRRPGEAALPVTDGVARRVVELPTGTATSTSDVTKVCGIIRLVSADATGFAARRPLPPRYPWDDISLRGHDNV
jgi:dTDP-4-amino-4,6-dideoxygalactose transaminase